MLRSLLALLLGATTGCTTIQLGAAGVNFFDIPTDNLFTGPVMVRDIKNHLDVASTVVVSPDVGGVVRARALAKRLDTPRAIVDKRRERAGESEVMNIIGDVKGKSCILIDDIVDSGGTLVNALFATGGPSPHSSSRDGHEHSAGARPGPACYGRGGTEPTITDANLVLGRIPPALIGGGIAPGSVLPTSGNANNYVHGGIGEFIGRVTFANAGIPYRLDFDSSAPVN